MNKTTQQKIKVALPSFSLASLFLVIWVLFPKLAKAYDPINNPALGDEIAGMQGSTFVGNLLSALLTLAFIVGSIIFLFTFIMGAIEWMTSGGDKMKNESARKKITNGIIGLVLLLSFFALVNFIEIFFDTDIRSFNIDDFSL